MSAATDFISPPSLDELTARFMARRSTGADDGADLATAEVEPHEVMGGFRTDSRVGWTEVTGYFRLLKLPAEKMAAVAEWASYAGMPAATFALPMAAGMFPQQVREFQPLLGTDDLSEFKPERNAKPIPGFGGLRGWAAKAGKGKSPAAALVAAGLTAGLGDTAAADAALQAAEPLCGDEWRAAWENQRAATLWLTGRHAEALAAWDSMADSPAVTFNRGMARLFLNRSAESVAYLERAATQLPDHSGWSHLANLYLSLAETRA